MLRKGKRKGPLTSGTQRQRLGLPSFPRFLVISSLLRSPSHLPPPPPTRRRRQLRATIPHRSTPGPDSLSPRARRRRWRTRCTALARSDPGKSYRTTSAASCRRSSVPPRNWIGTGDEFSGARGVGFAGTRRARTRSSCGSTRCTGTSTRRSTGCTPGSACSKG